MISDRVSWCILGALTCVTTGSIGVMVYYRQYYPSEYAAFVLSNRQGMEAQRAPRSTATSNGAVSKWSWNGTGIMDSIPQSVCDFLTLSNVPERMKRKKEQRAAEIQELVDKRDY